MKAERRGWGARGDGQRTVCRTSPKGPALRSTLGHVLRPHQALRLTHAASGDGMGAAVQPPALSLPPALPAPPWGRGPASVPSRPVRPAPAHPAPPRGRGRRAFRLRGEASTPAAPPWALEPQLKDTAGLR